MVIVRVYKYSTYENGCLGDGLLWFIIGLPTLEYIDPILYWMVVIIS